MELSGSSSPDLGPFYKTQVQLCFQRAEALPDHSALPQLGVPIWKPEPSSLREPRQNSRPEPQCAHLNTRAPTDGLQGRRGLGKSGYFPILLVPPVLPESSLLPVGATTIKLCPSRLHTHSLNCFC